MTTTIKICGVSELRSGLAAIDAGAHYLGFVFYPPSIRFLELDVAARLIGELRDARPDGWRAVGVFVNEPLQTVERAQDACHLDVVQLNGEELPEYIHQIDGPVFKAVRYRRGEAFPTAAALNAERILLDANVPGRYGGTGVTYDWAEVRSAVADGFLAGGLAPDNATQALKRARPWGVDVSSGVERDGVKSVELIERFIAAVRAFDAALETAHPSTGSG